MDQIKLFDFFLGTFYTIVLISIAITSAIWYDTYKSTFLLLDKSEFECTIYVEPEHICKQYTRVGK